MGLGIVRVGVVGIIGDDQRDPRLRGHSEKLLVHQLLVREAMVLHLQEEISFPEDLQVAERRLLSFLVLVPGQVPGHLARQAGGAGDDPLVELPEGLQVHPGLVVKTVHEAAGDDLREVRVSCVVLRQEDQVIIAVLPFSGLPVEAGPRGHIDFTAQHRTDPGFLRGFVEVDDAVHGAVVRDGEGVHSQFLRPGHDLLDLAGAVQQGILCMNVQMCKSQSFSSPPVNAESA